MIWTTLAKVGEEIVRKAMTEGVPTTANQIGEFIARVRDHAKQPLDHPDFGAGEIRLTEWRNGCWSAKWYSSTSDRQVAFIDDATEHSARQVFERISAGIEQVRHSIPA